MIHSYFLSATNSDWPSLPQRSPQDLFQTSSKPSISWPTAQSTTKPILTTNWLTGLLFHHLALKPISFKQVQNQVSPKQLQKAPQTATLPPTRLLVTALSRHNLAENGYVLQGRNVPMFHSKPFVIDNGHLQTPIKGGSPQLTLKSIHPKPILITLLLQNPASHKPHTTHSRAQP